MSKLGRLLADIVTDAMHVYVIRERCATVVHRARWIVETGGSTETDHPAGISMCGVKGRGGWRTVSAEYTGHPQCLRCVKLIAKLTHEATEQERKNAKPKPLQH